VSARVGIVMGSSSDRPTMDHAAAILKELGVEAEVREISAHRTPDALREWVAGLEARGIKVVIAGAGGAAHLAGAVAAHTTLPVIGVPLAAPNAVAGGLDALLSTAQMPRGVPVATVAIGNAENAALLAAEILALHDDLLRARLEARRAAMRQAVMGDPSNEDLAR
jgi:phosphoribosylaminoimidazole carboxylase PurE protein